MLFDDGKCYFNPETICDFCVSRYNWLLRAKRTMFCEDCLKKPKEKVSRFHMLTNMATKNQQKESYKNFLENKQEEGNLFPKGTSDREGMNILIKYLLGNDWYTVSPVSKDQVNTEAIAEIIHEYRGKGYILKEEKAADYNNKAADAMHEYERTKPTSEDDEPSVAPGKPVVFADLCKYDDRIFCLHLEYVYPGQLVFHCDQCELYPQFVRTGDLNGPHKITEHYKPGDRDVPAETFKVNCKKYPSFICKQVYLDKSDPDKVKILFPCHDCRLHTFIIGRTALDPKHDGDK